MRAGAVVSGARGFAPELDVLRGFAALLMIVNHAGFHWLTRADATNGVSGGAVFIGSFAPVVFFFATGFGIAFSGAAKQAHRSLGGPLFKAGLLIVADQFFAWPVGSAWALDFFSFIAIASITVTLVARVRRPERLCWLLMGALLVLRYAVGPVLRQHGLSLGPADWIVGVRPIDCVSYPLSPWMVYPLLGFVLGRRYARLDLADTETLRRWAWGGGVSMSAALVVAAVMAWADTGFLRWGTVSLGFFVLSLPVLLGLAAVSIAAARFWPRVSERLALRGVASFAVIPVHYALLECGRAALQMPLSPAWFGLAVLPLIAVSFTLSAWFSNAVSMRWVAEQRAWLQPSIFAALAGIAAITWLTAGLGSVWTSVLVTAGQLTVAALLGLRTPAFRKGQVPVGAAPV